MNDAFEILREMIHIAPAVRVYNRTLCLYCSGDCGVHDDECPWLRGKTLLDKIEKATKKRMLD